MKIAIVGAGFAGLVAAKTLTEFGHDVVVYERAPDVGGVWSRTRRYPGLTTQNDKGTYAFSDLPMPRSYPEWPSGEQVQAYLESYVRQFGLAPLLRLGTEVVRAAPRPTGGWTVDVRSGSDLITDDVEYLVVANGVFSDPQVPDYVGTEAFVAAGGRLVHSSEVTGLDQARGRDVVVVGYGKSACDLAVALSDVATTTTVIARELTWKLPKRLGGVLNYKYLLLTRLGESLFPYQSSTRLERVLHAGGSTVPGVMTGSVESLVSRQLRLPARGLVPPGRFADIARSTVSLVTGEFYERVGERRITVHRECAIIELLAIDGRPHVRLDTGAVLPADVVACGTGFYQRVPFLESSVQAQLTDARGDFELHRYILPLTVPDLAFCGYNSSFFSPLSAEIASLWIADLLAGRLQLPPVEQRRREIRARLRWMRERTAGKHAHGTSVVPFSMHAIDELLADLDISLGRRRRLREWLLPVDPSAYRVVAGELHRRHAEAAGRPDGDPGDGPGRRPGPRGATGGRRSGRVGAG